MYEPNRISTRRMEALTSTISRAAVRRAPPAGPGLRGAGSVRNRRGMDLSTGWRQAARGRESGAGRRADRVQRGRAPAEAVGVAGALSVPACVESMRRDPALRIRLVDAPPLASAPRRPSYGYGRPDLLYRRHGARASGGPQPLRSGVRRVGGDPGSPAVASRPKAPTFWLR